MSDDNSPVERPKVVEQAIERLKLAAEAEQAQRNRENDDLAFQVPEKQWTKEAIDARKGQTVAGVAIPGRPTLSIPKLDQPVQLILNAEKAAHLGVQVHPLSEDADDDTAEIMQGLYRCIERESRANLARSWGFERGVKAGRGAYRVLTEPAHDYAKTKDQEIVIKRILYQDSVYFDPFAIEPDWSDGEWAFVVSWMSWAKYQRLHKKKKVAGAEVASLMAGFDDRDLNGLMLTCPDWIKGDGESRAVLVAEYFTVEGDGDDRKVMWRLINGVEVLDERVWMGKYIPIIPVIGRELIPFGNDGERRWVGVYGPNKDGQRLFNHAASTAVESAAAEPKNTWVVAEGTDEGYEHEYFLANQFGIPVLHYKPKTFGPNNEMAPPPHREQVDTSKLALSMQMLSMANEFISSGTQTFDPSLGKSNPNVKTAKGTLALQQQSEQSNSNWMDNLVEISLMYEAKVVLDLMIKVYDRPGRIARTLNIEDETSLVALNQPFLEGKGKGKRPMVLQQGQPLPEGVKPDQIKHYDLKRGTYGVSVSIGKGYKSRLEEGNDALGNLFQAEPELFKFLGDIWLEFQSWPGHKQAAERIKKMLPPPLQDQDGQNAEQEAQQLKGQLQQMHQAMQEMQKALETDKVKVDGQVQIAKFKGEVDLQKAQLDVKLQAMKDATAIRVKEIEALTKGVVIAHEAEHEAVAMGREHAFTAAEAAKERAHQLGMTAQGAQVAGQQADQAAAHSVAQAEQGQSHALEAGDVAHQQALEAGDAGHAQNLEAAQQAADLAPEPEAGA